MREKLLIRCKPAFRRRGRTVVPLGVDAAVPTTSPAVGSGGSDRLAGDLAPRTAGSLLPRSPRHRCTRFASDRVAASVGALTFVTFRVAPHLPSGASAAVDGSRTYLKSAARSGRHARSVQQFSSRIGPEWSRQKMHLPWSDLPSELHFLVERRLESERRKSHRREGQRRSTVAGPAGAEGERRGDEERRDEERRGDERRGAERRAEGSR